MATKRQPKLAVIGSLRCSIRWEDEGPLSVERLEEINDEFGRMRQNKIDGRVVLGL